MFEAACSVRTCKAPLVGHRLNPGEDLLSLHKHRGSFGGDVFRSSYVFDVSYSYEVYSGPGYVEKQAVSNGALDFYC